MSHSKRKPLDLGALGDATSNTRELDKKALSEAAGETHNPIEVMEAKMAGKAKSRIGKKQIQGYFDPELRKQMKMLSAASDRSIEDLLEEAITDLFAKYKDVLA